MAKRVLTPEQYRHLASEQDFQRTVVRMAKLHGWLVFHPWISIHSQAGWPDVAMVRDGVLVLAELKSMGGKVRPGQQRWLDELLAVADQTKNVRVFLWRPTDFDYIEQVIVHGLM
jgi:hypothetical protein